MPLFKQIPAHQRYRTIAVCDRVEDDCMYDGEFRYLIQKAIHIPVISDLFGVAWFTERDFLTQQAADEYIADRIHYEDK